MRRRVPFGYDGSLLLARGQVLPSRGYGSADPERGVPFTARDAVLRRLADQARPPAS